MGEPKSLLEIDGETLLRRTARVLIEGGADSVTVVVADPEIARHAEEFATVVWNREPERGMLSSVQCALAALPAGASLLVCPCDLPGLTPSQVAAVLGADDTDPRTIVVPIHAGRRGHPAWFGPELAGDIVGLDSEREGLNALIQRHADRVVEVPVADDGPITDVDTQVEWKAFLQHARKEVRS